MSKLGWATRIGGFALAPFTGGWSVPAGGAAAAAIEHQQGKNDGPNGGDDDDGFDHPESPFTAALQESSERMRATGTGLVNQGQQSIGPLLRYFADLYGDNPSGVMDATRGDRARVIDQFDTARRAITEFGPRGGGMTSALAESRLSQGENLAAVTSDARNDARGQAAALGTSTLGLGLSANQLASQDLNAVIDAVLTREGFDVAKRGQNMEMFASLGEALGTILGEKIGQKP